MRLIKLGLLVLCLLVSAPASAQERRLKIGFAISRTVDDMFYGPVVAFMQNAARDLKVDLKIIEVNGDYLQTQPMIEALHKSIKLDGVIVVSVKDSGAKAIRYCESANIPILIENAAVMDESIGNPRQKYKRYIGDMLPDDEMAGYELAKYLIKKGKPAKSGKIQVVAITGAFGTTASSLRELGLRRAVKESGNVELMQVVSAKWDMQAARQIFKGLRERFPESSVVWAASDGMAIGASQAAEDLHLVPGKDLVIGGVDWSQEGIAAVKADKIQASAGGHFMEGAWALIAMTDYLRGLDFVNTDGAKMKTSMTLLTRDNLSRYQSVLDRNAWQKIDFTQFSKKHDGELKRYDFSLEKVIKEVGNKR